jgi:hypothetical protein
VGLLSTADIAGMAATLGDLANAHLTKIETPGAPDTRGRATALTTAWAGSARGYLERRSREDLVTDRQAMVGTDTFTILDAEGAPIVEQAGPTWKGSVVTIADERSGGSIVTRWRVADVVHEAFGTLDSVTLALEPEA